MSFLFHFYFTLKAEEGHMAPVASWLRLCFQLQSLLSSQSQTRYLVISILHYFSTLKSAATALRNYRAEHENTWTHSFSNS